MQQPPQQLSRHPVGRTCDDAEWPPWQRHRGSVSLDDRYVIVGETFSQELGAAGMQFHCYDVGTGGDEMLRQSAVTSSQIEN